MTDRDSSSDRLPTHSGPHPLAELVKTRLREFAREKGTIFWVFGFPLLMAVGLGIAFRSRPPELPHVAVITTGQGHAALAAQLLKSERLHAQSASAAEARREVAQAKVDIAVTLDAQGPSYLFDPENEQAVRARLVVDDVLQRAAGRRDALTTRDVTNTALGSRYIDFLLPGLIGLNLMGSSMWGVGYNLVVARKRRLLRRYAVTPMRRSHFLLSYFFSRAFFLVLELAILLAFGALVFGAHAQGSLATLALVAFVGAASFGGVSLLIGARVETTESANGWMNLVQLPMWVLSGAFFSYERFPEWLHGPIRALPLTAVVDALRAVFNEGAPLLTLLPELGVLTLWGALSFAIALRTFRWQ